MHDFNLGLSDIHVWTIPLNRKDLDLKQLAEFLSGNEVEDSTRFKFPELKRRFIVRRAARKIVLAKYLKIPAHELKLSQNGQEKPQLDYNSGNLKLEFNTSHSAETGLIAVAMSRVGLDIEKIKEIPDMDSLLEKVGSISERASLAALLGTKRADEFYQLWATKESIVKATGEGLSAQFNEISVDIVAENQVLDRNGIRLHVRKLPIAPGFKASLATEIPNPHVSIFNGLSLLKKTIS